MVNWFKNYSKSTKKLNRKNILNFLVAWYRYLFTNFGWKKEQAKWRESQAKKFSPECIKLNYCKNCYCDFPEKFYENDGCETCYPDWMDKYTWIKFKKENDKV